MRYVGDIATTDSYKISLYTWNEKYIVKIEAGPYEQMYKVNQLDFWGDEAALREIFADEVFLKSVFARFQQMHSDFNDVLTRFDLV
ncbi:hypothetical protein FHS57_001028 [Runella defluvii]|uniref:Uncharacterized protein n=1 Tax=Runella defluvii TaxID=370973 RepID=A0A7W5ZJJ6_9BACT|nr:hypothetical protein [Runella defluvii]MBB3837034.1 hypothetical protein [Runella defluvii]